MIPLPPTLVTAVEDGRRRMDVQFWSQVSSQLQCPDTARPRRSRVAVSAVRFSVLVAVRRGQSKAHLRQVGELSDIECLLTADL